MPVTGNQLTKADLLTSINADIYNNPAVLIRGDVMAQKIADIEESSVNILTDYSANFSVVVRQNVAGIANVTLGPDTVLGRLGSGNIQAIAWTDVRDAIALAFIQLTDTPVSYTAAALQFPMVNGAQTGLVFANIFGATNTITARVASTANVTVSNPGTAVFDGVTLANGDRIVLWFQTSQPENGVYVFNGSGSALTRTTDADSGAELTDEVVFVQEGTLYGRRYLSQILTVSSVGSDNVQYVINQIGGNGGNGGFWSLALNNANANAKFGTSNNRAVPIYTNNVIRGTITAAGLFSWGSSDQFNINTSGRLSKYNNAAPTDGQVLIGDTAAGYFKAASLTAGSNITITPGAGTITIAASGSSLPSGTSGQTLRYDSSNVLVATSYLFNDGANIGVNITSSFSALVHIKGTGATSGTSSLFIQNSTDSRDWQFRNDGALLRDGFLQSIDQSNGFENCSWGNRALGSITSGGDNTGIGWLAGRLITSASNCTAVGASALNALQTGNGNTAVGAAAGLLINGDDGNTAVGDQALKTVTSGSYNTAIGQLAGFKCATTSIRNTFFGKGSGNALAVGEVCTARIGIGYNSTPVADNQCTIGGQEGGITSLVIGNNVYSGTPAAVAITITGRVPTGNTYGITADTDGDASAATLSIIGASGTGAGAGGSVLIKVCIASSTGNTSNSPTTIMEVLGSGLGVVLSGAGALTLTRITSTQRDALTPVKGMIIYNTTTDKFQGYDGAWTNLE